MKRQVISQLTEWRQSPTRKPLLLLGPRQVGKTYILSRFGEDSFPNTHLFDFVEEPGLAAIFEADLKPDRITQDLELFRGVDIDLREDLIIFDEIQACPKALASLKYFAQKMPKAFVAASGSLLGTSLTDDLFPVGKVRRLSLYPMNFAEFLEGIGQERLGRALGQVTTGSPLSRAIHEQVWKLFRFYLITGGLPEVVAKFADLQDRPNRAFQEVRTLQKELLSGYLDDIAKHAGKLKAVKIEAVFKNIPLQLARESKGVKKFVFKDVLSGPSRYSTLEGPIEWLKKAGLIHQVMICSKGQLPLPAFADEKRFKLYLFDVGILGAMLELPAKTIYDYDYGTYKGYMIENFVLSELISRWDKSLFCWQHNTSELEFLLEVDGDIVPVEVKAGVNPKSKSLSVYCDKFSPPRTLLLTALPMQAGSNGKLRLPLYMASQYPLPPLMPATRETRLLKSPKSQ